MKISQLHVESILIERTGDTARSSIQDAAAMTR